MKVHVDLLDIDFFDHFFLETGTTLKLLAVMTD